MNEIRLINKELGEIKINDKGYFAIPDDIYNAIEQLQNEHNILTEFEKWLEEELKEKTFNVFPIYDLEKQDFVNNEIHYAPVEKIFKEILLNL